jgi:hypothetical protein
MKYEDATLMRLVNGAGPRIRINAIKYVLKYHALNKHVTSDCQSAVDSIFCKQHEEVLEDAIHAALLEYIESKLE